jgi:hypothetical protein
MFIFFWSGSTDLFLFILAIPEHISGEGATFREVFLPTLFQHFKIAVFNRGCLAKFLIVWIVISPFPAAERRPAYKAAAWCEENVTFVVRNSLN